MRIASARAAAQSAFFINARSDVFLQSAAETHNLDLLELAIARAQAYAEVGASGLFLPGLMDLRLIAAAVKRSPLPMNIMMGGHELTRRQLAEVGVARISHGPEPFMMVMKHLQNEAGLALA